MSTVAVNFGPRASLKPLSDGEFESGLNKGWPYDVIERSKWGILHRSGDKADEKWLSDFGLSTVGIYAVQIFWFNTMDQSHRLNVKFLGALEWGTEDRDLRLKTRRALPSTHHFEFLSFVVLDKAIRAVVPGLPSDRLYKPTMSFFKEEDDQLKQRSLYGLGLICRAADAFYSRLCKSSHAAMLSAAYMRGKIKSEKLQYVYDVTKTQEASKALGDMYKLTTDIHTLFIRSVGAWAEPLIREFLLQQNKLNVDGILNGDELQQITIAGDNDAYYAEVVRQAEILAKG